MAGEKLTESNPAIADLSDQFRPTKLSEMFSEVYDNEWTDAFEELSEVFEGDQAERKAIHYILEILKETFKLSQYVWSEQTKNALRIMSGFVLAEEESEKKVSDYSPTELEGSEEESPTCIKETNPGFEEPSFAMEGSEEEPLTDEKGAVTEIEGFFFVVNKEDMEVKAEDPSSLLNEKSTMTEGYGFYYESVQLNLTDGYDETQTKEVPVAVEGVSVNSCSDEQNGYIPYDTDVDRVYEDSRTKHSEGKPMVLPRTPVDGHTIDREETNTPAPETERKVDTDLTDENVKSIMKIQKEKAMLLSKAVAEGVSELVRRKFHVDEGSRSQTVAYIRKCANLCWKMAVHDPPLYISILQQNDTVNKNDLATLLEQYRAYTKTGKQLEFVVWPALFLHQGGPMLSKGVAQFA